MAKDDRRTERRLITALFIDIVGSTQLTMTLGPERMKRALDAAFSELRDVIVREGGTVEKYVGDEIYALFGAPVSHPDDPLRALRAAEGALRWAGATRVSGQPFDVRGGVETGEALVDVTASEIEHQQMSVGACVNIAARLQQAAEAGQALVGPTLHEVTAELAEFQALGEVPLKGIGPTRAWSLVRVAPARAPRGLPFVGREAELDLLDFALRRARSGRAVLALVSGPPGQGKTRIVEEFLRRVGDGTRALIARCRPGGETGMQTPLRQLLAADAPDLDAERVAARARELLEDPVAAERVGAALAHCAGLAVSEDLSHRPVAERNDEITNAWRRYLGALARNAPVIVWLEDVHWADPDLVRLVDRLTLASDIALLVVATARPEFAEHAGLRPSGDRFFVELSGLDEATARVLADHAGGPRGVEVKRAEGNPLFLIELARSRAPSTEDLPLSLQGVIGARLDELAPADRDLLRYASVSGERFAATDVAFLAEREPRDVADALDRLANLQYLHPVDGGYRFHHALVRDVAYGRLPIADRMRLHARYAQSAVHPEDVEALAHHWWEAFRSPDADWVWEGHPEAVAMRREAFEAHVGAGRRYADRFAFERALEASEHARTLARGDLEIARAEHALGSAYFEMTRGDPAWEHFRSAVNGFGRAGSDPPTVLYADMLTLAVERYGYFREHRPPEDAARLMDEAEAAARRAKDDVVLARLLIQRANFLRDASARHEALRIADGAVDPRPFAETLAGVAYSQYVAGEFEQAAATFARVERLIETGARLYDESLFALQQGYLFHALGDLERAAELGRRAYALCASRGPHLRTHAHGFRATLLLSRGDWPALLDLGNENERLVRENPATTFCIVGARCPAAAAAAHALAGRMEDVDAAIRVIDRMVSATARGEARVLPLALLGRSGEVLEAIRLEESLPPSVGVFGTWFLDPLVGTVWVILERWEELGRVVERLRPYAARSPYLAALVDAFEEELAAARGGPQPSHAALRSLGYVGRSQLLRYRPPVS